MTQASALALDRGARARTRPGELALEQERLPDGTYVLSVAGEIDLHTAPRLGEALEDAVEEGMTSVVVDLTECSFLDSSALGLFIEAHQHLRGSGKQLALVAGKRGLPKVLEITGLETLFTIYPSRSHALAGKAETWVEEARRRVSIRVANEQLERSCGGLGASGEDEFLFMCECGDRACTVLLHVTLAEYESVRAHPARFLIARNHENPEAERVVEEYGRFAIIETVTGELAKPALESNPRWQRGEPW